MPSKTMSRRDVLKFLRTLSAYPIASSLTLSRPARPVQDTTRNRSAPSLALVNPRLAHPLFVEPGGECNVEVATMARLDPSRWSVVLSTDLGAAWPCPVVDVGDEGIDYGRRAGWRLRVRVPSDITPELMTIRVNHSDAAGPVEEVRALSVVPSLWTDSYLLHLTDEHVMYDSHKHYACDNPRSGYSSADLVRLATPVVNILNPRLVINSGDQAHQYATTGYRYSYNDDIYRCYLNAKRGYRVPTMMVLGNHEVHEKDAEQRARDWARWEALAGRRYYHIRLGSLVVYAHDYLDPVSRAFIAKLYEDSFRNGSIEGRIFVQHHTWSEGYEAPSDKAPTLMLIGHLHRQSVEDRWPAPILMSTAAHNYGTGSLIRLKRRDGRWTTDAASDWWGCALRLVGDYGAPNITVSSTEPNDGSARSNRITVTNKLAQGFGDGRLRLIMADGGYSVRGGNVVRRYRTPSGKTAVLMQIEVGAKDSLEIEVTPQTKSVVDMHVTPAESDPPLLLEPAVVDETILHDSSDGVLAPVDPGAITEPAVAEFTVNLPLVGAERETDTIKP
jgi:hypothetical protein